MTGEAGDGTDWQTCFTELHQDLGVCREGLYEYLGHELCAIWKITPDMARDETEVRKRVADALETLMAGVNKTHKGKELPKLDRAKFSRSLHFSYNITGRPDIERLNLGRRQKRLAETDEIGESTSRLYVSYLQAYGLLVIEEQVKALSPESPPEPEPEQQKPQPDPPRPDNLSTTPAFKALMRDNWSTPDHDALAVLAFSCGKGTGVHWASELLFRVTDSQGNDLGRDTVRARDAIRLARKRGINRGHTEIARREFAAQGAPTVPPGRYDIVDGGLRRRFREPWGFNRKYKARMADNIIAREFQRLSLEQGGRLDLAGDWTDEVVQEHGDDIARRGSVSPPDGMSRAALLDGMRRATLAQLVNAHPLALVCVSDAAKFVFTHGTTDERLSMATWILELATGPATPATSGDRHHHIAQLLYDLREFGITSRAPSKLADELAAHVPLFGDKPTFTGADLMAQSRLG